ncbi:MAG: glycosyltransferase family 39 protein [Candidatus Aenigmatarchaeota archaeon]
MMEKEIEITLRSPLFFLLLTILLYYFYLQLKVVLPNPIAFGDEGFHTAMARYIANNLEYPKYIPFEGTQLIKDGFYRPPLWNFLLASFLFFFGLNEFLPKIITLIITFLLGISTFVLIKRNFSEIYAFIVSILLVSFQSVITYTVLFYYADLLLFFVNLSILSFITYLKEKNKKFLILSSLFASLSFLTNQFALTLYVSFLFFIIFEHISTRNILKETLKQYLPFFLILLIVPSGYLIRNLFVYKTIFCFSFHF